MALNPSRGIVVQKDYYRLLTLVVLSLLPLPSFLLQYIQSAIIKDPSILLLDEGKLRSHHNYHFRTSLAFFLTLSSLLNLV